MGGPTSSIYVPDERYSCDNEDSEDKVITLKQCGTTALSCFGSFLNFDARTDSYGESFYADYMLEDHISMVLKKISQEELNKWILKGEMDWFDIVTGMSVLHRDMYPDFRYNSKTRDTEGRLFFSNLRGITALKFKDTQDLHWAIFWKGSLYPLINSGYEGYNDIDEVKYNIPEFDGFGHTIMFRDKDEIKLLKRFKKCTGLYCKSCCRSEWCEMNI